MNATEDKESDVWVGWNTSALYMIKCDNFNKATVAF